ncbi:hypothetical protein ROZALSC1DRAFT_30956 [Rozella allomycis CSF55]|uniref:RNA polymerase I associated factor, A49-like domain-containing protein n=1 Tax=Rozella allomycis (strain CSF55) TaxID=988480 RepID=A0A4P9YE77_ROZAC|nr:hypothetical protein ROZALSC1DRAFT_30956 [Rozella allomycis CSF55]
MIKPRKLIRILSEFNKSHFCPGCMKFSIKVEDKPALDPPYVVSFQGQAPHNSSLEFQAYAPTDEKKRGRQRYVEAVTDHVKYKGHNSSESSVSRSQMTRYAIGVIDKEKNEIVVKSAPFIRITSHSLKLEKATAEDVQQLSVMDARNDLGETFGNKKRKKDIKTIQRSVIDTDALSSAKSYITSAIEESTLVLPETQELEEMMDEGRPIPPYHKDAENIEDVYLLDDVIVDVANMDISPLLNAQSTEEIDEVLSNDEFPEYVKERLRPALSLSIKDEETIRALVLLSYFIRLRKLNAASLKPHILQPIFKYSTYKMAEQMLELFTEATDIGKGKKKHKLSLSVERQAYLLAECFKTAGFYIERKRVDGKRETDRIAKFKVPLTFPKPRRGAAK